MPEGGRPSLCINRGTSRCGGGQMWSAIGPGWGGRLRAGAGRHNGGTSEPQWGGEEWWWVWVNTAAGWLSGPRSGAPLQNGGGESEGWGGGVGVWQDGEGCQRAHANGTATKEGGVRLGWPSARTLAGGVCFLSSAKTRADGCVGQHAGGKGGRGATGQQGAPQCAHRDGHGHACTRAGTHTNEHTARPGPALHTEPR